MKKEINPKLLMLKGLPASGKTTYAKKLVDDGWVRVNKDDLRAMLDNGRYSKDKEAFITSLRDEIIIRGLVNGRNVVVDDVNLDPKHAIHLQSIASEFIADYSEKFFDVSVEECIERNQSRDKPIPDKVIYNMYERYLQQEPIAIEYDDEKEECIIVDIDGTLAHISDGRDPYDITRVCNDSLDDAVASIVAMAYANGYRVIIITGRSEKYKEVTEEWLEDNGVPYDEIYTRSDSQIDEKGNQLDDAIVKEELFREYVEPRFNTKFVLDDRNRVVDMWRRIGLKCLQVQEGNF